MSGNRQLASRAGSGNATGDKAVSGKASSGKVARRQRTAVNKVKIHLCTEYVYLEYDRPSEDATYIRLHLCRVNLLG